MPAHKAKKSSPKHKSSAHKAHPKKNTEKAVHEEVEHAQAAPQAAIQPEITVQSEPVEPVIDATQSAATTEVAQPADQVSPQPAVPAAEPVIENDTAQQPVAAEPAAQTATSADTLITQDTPLASEQEVTTQPTADASSEPEIAKEGELISGVQEQAIMEPQPKSKGKFIVIAAFILLVSVLLGGVVVYSKSLSSFSQLQPKKAVVTAQPTTVPVTPTVAAVDKSKYEIKVLNGSGVSGLAAQAKTDLENDGFTVSSIGNGDNSLYKKTVIQAKEEVDAAFLDALKNSLSATYVLDAVASLSATSTDDVVVTLGSDKVE